MCDEYEALINIVKEEDKKIRDILKKKEVEKGEKWPTNRSCFWAAKYLDGKNDIEKELGKGYYPGYSLYLYGGHALDIYIGWNKKITYKMFDSEYVRKKDKVRNEALESIRNSKIKIEWTKRGEELANGIFSIEDWTTIIDSFSDWAFGRNSYQNKKNLERMRECIIADYSVDSAKSDTEFYVFDIESAERIKQDNNEEIEAKPDMMAVIKRKDEGNSFCFIEYKCTDDATKGNYSFINHFNKMVKYYKDEKYLKKVGRLYENKCKLQGIEAHNVTGSEIVFVISNISEEKKEGYVTRNRVIKKLEECNIHKDKIKIVLMDKKEKPKIVPDDFLPFDEAINKLKNNGK